MKYTLAPAGILLAASIAIGSLSTGANAATLTFDDVPGGSHQNGVETMPTYQGFTFSGTFYWIDVVGSWYDYGAKSGDFALLNNHGGEGLIALADNGDFTFGGLWAKAWGTAPESGGADSVFGSMSGYNNGVEVWSVPTSLNGSYNYFGAQSGAIDELRLDLGTFFLADDINVSAVPEPSSALLIGLGALGLVGRRRR